MAEAPAGLLRFGEFELDPAASELRHRGRSVALHPQPVRVLERLVRAGGQLVCREELYELLWPDGGVDRERALNTLVRQLRIGLRGCEPGLELVRTYPKRGYRFVDPGPARAGEPGSVGHLPERTSPLPARPPSSGRAWRRIGLAAALVAAAVLASASGSDSASPPSGAMLEALYLLRHPDPGRRAEAAPLIDSLVRSGARPQGAEVALAEAYFWGGDYREARHWVDSALGASPGDHRALFVRGNLELVADWNWPSALADLSRAIQLSPKQAEYHVALGFALATAGRAGEAVWAFEEGYRLDPVSAVVVNDLGYGYLWAGRFEEAAVRCGEAARLEPRARVGLDCAFVAEVALGRTSRALRHARRIVGNAGDDPARVIGTDTGSVGLARFRRWRADRLARQVEEGRASAFTLAVALADLGDSTAALDWLERATGEPTLGLVTALVDPRLARLRDSERFRALVRSLGWPSPPS
ncbi:MAG: winged helix-turn-helix domain-containing protein [Gemmatimonadales bacterium]